jgi:geranylgeranyl pyrophosphate synthase
MLTAEEFGLRASGMEDLVHLRMSHLDQSLLPALTLAVSRMAGPVSDTVISLSSIIQHIYLAQHIHSQVKDPVNGEAVRQFPILVGDYIIGQSFVKMCDKDLFPYISNFVAVIKTINEGIILRWRLKNKKISVKDYKYIIGKERASLTAMAARLGAEVSGIKKTVRSPIRKTRLSYRDGLGRRG